MKKTGSNHVVKPCRRPGERGQATFELAALLVGLVAVILGLVFVCGLGLADNELLLSAKYEAEKTARASSADAGVSGSEYAGWIYRAIDPFNRNQKSTIPFTPGDSALRKSDNSIDSAGSYMNDRRWSSPTRYSAGEASYTYEYDWLSPRDFDNALTHDYHSDVAGGDNALDAARLVVADADGKVSDNALLDAQNQAGAHSSTRALKIMQESFFNWFGVKISAADLSNSPANRVSLPAAGGEE